MSHEDESSSLVSDTIKRYVDSRFHKESKGELTLWIKILTPVVPFVIGYFVWSASLDKRLAVLESKQAEIAEIKADVKAIYDIVFEMRVEQARVRGSRDELE